MAFWADDHVEMFKVQPVFGQSKNPRSREARDPGSSRNKVTLHTGKAQVDNITDIIDFYTFEPKKGEEIKIGVNSIESFGPKSKKITP